MDQPEQAVESQPGGVVKPDNEQEEFGVWIKPCLSCPFSRGTTGDGIG
jgi:hypothetical protein